MDEKNEDALGNHAVDTQEPFPKFLLIFFGLTIFAVTNKKRMYLLSVRVAYLLLTCIALGTKSQHSYKIIMICFLLLLVPGPHPVVFRADSCLSLRDHSWQDCSTTALSLL